MHSDGFIHFIRFVVLKSKKDSCKACIGRIQQFRFDVAQVALLGYGCTEPQLQSTAFAELCKLAKNPKMLVNGLGGKGPSGPSGPSFLAMALRAVGATLLPLNLGPSRGAQTAEAARLQAECVASAEARAGNLAAAILQVLVDSQSDFSQLEALLMQLVSACTDPKWAAAPLLALRMIGALRRVAGASRGVDLECARREEATRLLGKAAEALCSQHLEATRATSAAPSTCKSCQSQMFCTPCDVCVLRRATPARLGAVCTDSVGAQGMLTLAGFQKREDVGHEGGLLAPSSTDLRGSAVPASCASCNVPFSGLVQ